jgi:hypothetical protein
MVIKTPIFGKVPLGELCRVTPMFSDDVLQPGNRDAGFALRSDN